MTLNFFAPKPPVKREEMPSHGSMMWEVFSERILNEYQRSRGARGHLRLMVVHPHSPLMEAIRALDRDDWNPDWPTPFYCRFESLRQGGVWIIMEALPEILRAVRGM
ncbi:MAG TPA: hypothetical protein VG733_16825 [Chthoniobacteraceae bacterium]|nr:hypothetical protein [Chthoniobacteraceae bacterium]